MSRLQKHNIYDPIEFIDKIELITITMIGTFATWRLLNVIYDNIYEPIIDNIISEKKTDEYYTKIGRYYIQIGIVMKEFIKWVVMLIFLMLIFNIMKHLND
uniref:Uncharacterized protein n=1 Tax=viral metagenome TaxID=1070528 RepID=A0A6C0CAZ3_9ZZZZ